MFHAEEICLFQGGAESHMLFLSKFDKSSTLSKFNQVNWVLRLLIVLLIFDNSADCDGWIKLIKRKEKNITFFDIPEINLKI